MSIRCRLDQILGRSGSKKPDVYESKISLASRIVKVERQVRANRARRMLTAVIEVENLRRAERTPFSAWAVA